MRVQDESYNRRATRLHPDTTSASMAESGNGEDRGLQIYSFRR
ncbi:hypothetical protein SAMN05444746_10220 [Variovorax sp. OK212]|nr:hypothetical protein SAMN05518853_10220 [Variovorax sp. OK202]SFC41377.1 hypothetical protein SAMN05444746_10220 [Variovorax sp. OK212]